MVLFGEMVKKARKSLKLTQKEISDGICTQGYYSEIEKGTKIPNIALASSICKKLDISFQYFDDPSDIYISDLKSKIENHFHNYDYNNTITILETNKSHFLLDNSLHNQQFFNFYYCMSKLILKSDIIDCIELLHYSSSFANKDFSPKCLFIYDLLNAVALGYAYQLADNKSNALYYSRLSLENIPLLIGDYDNKNKILIYYFCAKTFHMNAQYNKAKKILEDGITFALSIKSDYFLPDLYFTLSTCEQTIGDNAKSMEYHQIASSLMLHPTFRIWKLAQTQ